MVLNIELNNENTIFDLWGDQKFHLLNEAMQKQLISQWRTFLKSKYATFEEINKFYNGDKVSREINLIENNTISCQKNNANYTINKNNNIVTITYNITKTPDVSWGNQISYGTIDITNSTFYTVEFDAKVTKKKDKKLAFRLQESKTPYRYYLQITDIELTTSFKHYSLYAKTVDDCQFAEGAKPIVKIFIPPEVNYYEIKDLKFYKGKIETTITEGNSRTLDTLLYPNDSLLSSLPNMAYDLRRFFYYTETNTQKSLQNYIKNDLGFKDIYIIDSQVNYGSMFSTEKRIRII